MHKLTPLLITTTLIANHAHALEIKGSLGAETRWFTQHKKAQTSAFGELEVYWDSENNNSITAKIFARADDTDDERTHGDLRELAWLRYADQWELKAGVSKVFWGVTESAHRVDIINQTDAVESPDGEEKLGQPLLQFSSIQDWGTLSAFALPYFRERTFESPKGYLGPQLPINTDDAQFESRRKQEHTDWALRYSHSVDVWDLGVSYFAGTSRDPSFDLAINNQGAVNLVPYYAQIQQTGLDVQATLNAWLWKLEATYQTRSANAQQRTQTPNFAALTAGFEYTYVGIANTAADLGMLAEIHRNSQGARTNDPLQKDIFIGARLALNDTQNSSILVGLIQDLDQHQSRLAFIEASRRFGNNWVITLDGRLFTASSSDDPLYPIEQGDHVTLDAAYFF